MGRIGAGDRQAEAELVRTYRRRLVVLIRSRTGDEDLAEDISQETLMTALKKLRPASEGDSSARLENPGSVAAFLHGIALRKLAGLRRTEARRGVDLNPDIAEMIKDDAAGPGEILSREQQRAAVRAALEELTVERDRDILISVFLRDEDRESICRRLGVDRDHFNRVLSRAKKRLREIAERGASDGGARVVMLRESGAERHY